MVSWSIICTPVEMSAPWPVHRGVMHRKVFDREHVVSDCVCFIVGGKLLVRWNFRAR